MIAGYDYLILRDGIRRFWNRARIAGVSLLLAGGVLIGVGAAYYGYASSARANLDNYEVSSVELVPVRVEQPPAPKPFPGEPSIIPEDSLYSGYSGFIPAPTGPILPDGFALVEVTEDNPLPQASAATSISIPAVNVEASIMELSIQDLGDRRAYQTPSHAVGHIPETADAGENGQAWFFGHTESPVLDEGSVFMTLQDIPGKLRLGEDVQIVTDNGTDQFLYQVTGTRVVHEDDLTLEGDGGPSIHLVSCVPRLVYDHRLIVDAELIARKSIN